MKKSYPKVKLLTERSPLEFLPNLSKRLGPKIYVKRDDSGGRAGGGNKLRKYQRIIADAIAQGKDTLIIAGHYQSNAARELVGAAAQLGLKSIVVCKEMIPEQNASFNQNGNALLMSLMDTKIVAIAQEDDFQQKMEAVAAEVTESGGKPYLIPFGGSNLLGALGYVDCANEIMDQCKEEEIIPNYVVVASGSGGTQSGLVAGFHMGNSKTKVVGISVLHNASTITTIVEELTNEILVDNNYNAIPETAVEVNDNYVGDGYGIPTTKGIDAIKLVAKTEALFLCPVYTSKAMAGLISYIEQGRIKNTDTVIFVHTGGMPLLHSYYDIY